jgi:hypothetical protein
MKDTSALAPALALLAAMFLSGIGAQAQHEVDPTGYPLSRAVAHPSHQPVLRSVKQGSVRHAQPTTANKTQKLSTGGTHHDAAKRITVAKSR